MTNKTMQVNLEKAAVIQPINLVKATDAKAASDKAKATSDKAKATKADSPGDKAASDTAGATKAKATKAAGDKPAVKEVAFKVDKITSGSSKDGVFAFNYRGKLINNALFPLVEANDHYASFHHIDNGNLAGYQNRCGIFPYSHSAEGQSPVAEHNHLTLTSWAELMKYYLATSIAAGDFNATGTNKAGDQVHVKVEWDGGPLAPPQLTYRKPPVKKDSKPAQDMLDGLSF